MTTRYASVTQLPMYNEAYPLRALDVRTAETAGTQLYYDK